MWILVPTLTLVFLLYHQEIPQVLRISRSSSSVEKMRGKKYIVRFLAQNFVLLLVGLSKTCNFVEQKTVAMIH
jgi:hypothetical protein